MVEGAEGCNWPERAGAVSCNRSVRTGAVRGCCSAGKFERVARRLWGTNENVGGLRLRDRLDCVLRGEISEDDRDPAGETGR